MAAEGPPSPVACPRKLGHERRKTFSSGSPKPVTVPWSSRAPPSPNATAPPAARKTKRIPSGGARMSVFASLTAANHTQQSTCRYPIFTRQVWLWWTIASRERTAVFRQADNLGTYLDAPVGRLGAAAGDVAGVFAAEGV